MIFKFKYLLTSGIFMLFLILGSEVNAQTSCCTKDKKGDSKSEICCSSSKADLSTSGCTPSNCRGAKTKFGEAKVITNLRSSLVSLKAVLEISEDPKFEPRTYNIHGMVGESDEESLQIIIDEVQLIEDYFSDELNFSIEKFSLPVQKANQVAYLNSRIGDLQSFL